ncbi:MAG: hypothetical protein P4L46_05830 [Fimbriimonas sp.]|nr:hypothetical protein [Fimbriimonas sp.]
MKPIEFRTDIEYLQALRCVEYRIPRKSRFRKPGYLAALGLRYGLVGVAATYHLLQVANDEDECCVVGAMRSWPRLVEDHVRFDLLDRLPFPTDSRMPVVVSELSERPLRLSVPYLYGLCSLERCLCEVSEAYSSENRDSIRMNWPWYRYRAAGNEFLRCKEESLRFALHFYERRLYDLQEVSEIVLLGE